MLDTILIVMIFILLFILIVLFVGMFDLYRAINYIRRMDRVLKQLENDYK